MADQIKQIVAARAAVIRSERRLREEIVQAFVDRSDGHTVREIAEAAGLTMQRVYQIVREMEDDRS